MTLEERVEKLESIIALKDAEIARLRERVAELERRLGENSRNSNLPPSSDSPDDRQQRHRDPPSGRKPGGQPGHKGHRRELLPSNQVTKTQDCFPKKCRGCGERLPRSPDANVLRHQVVEIPQIRPDVTEYRLHRVECACGETTCGVLPRGVPRGMLGPQLLALVALLVGGCHVSRRKVQVLLRDLLNIAVSLGTLSESEEVVSEAVAAAVDEARVHALSERVKHLDATTWYQRGRFKSLWTLATAAVTVFVIAKDATRKKLLEWLDQMRGVLVSDRGTQFEFWTMGHRQICWAHLIRKFAAFAMLQGKPGEIGAHLLECSRELIREWHRIRDGTLTRRAFQKRIVPLRNLIELLLMRGAEEPGIAGACQNIFDHRAALWTFVHRTGVEPTNNHAERELRGFVLWRKICLGSQSDRGDRFAARIKSVVHTCRKQKRHVLTYLTRAIQADLCGRSTPSLLGAAP